MASVEFIEKRIAGKEKELEKLNKKLERIRKVEAQNWQDPNPYYYSERDLRITLRDIDDAQTALNNYKKQLATEQEKEASRNVPAIVEFLNGWRARVTDYYAAGLEEYYLEKCTVRDLYEKIKDRYFSSSSTDPDYLAYKAAKEALFNKCHGYYEKQEFINRWGKLDYKQVKVKDGEYEWLNPYFLEQYISDAYKRLKKDLDREWNRKYDFIIERTIQIVGQITDASNLRIGAKHDLNGFIIGTKGKAKVQTIDAGGYNIQCYHFRTLINKA
jgi:hypothetical protein